jgi:hypothetical protein
MSTFFKERFLVNYDNFLEQLKIIFTSDETQIVLNNLVGLSTDSKIEHGINYANSIDDTNFDYFVKNKIKVFSHKNPDTQKISESLFGSELCLKNLLNNQPDDVKEVIWVNLHTLLLMSELLKEPHNEARIKTLSDVITKERGLPTEQSNAQEEIQDVTKRGKQTLKDMFGSDINKETSEMLDDIVGSFEGLLSNNPSKSLGGIMEISQKITTKYSEKINKGEIQLDKLMEAISKKVPGLEKMLGGMKGMMAPKDEKPKEKIIIDENFSTAAVDVGQVKEETSSGMNIGNMLKMAQNFGVLGGKKSDKQSTEQSAEQSGDSIPHMGKMLEIMQRLEKASSPEDTAAIKKEMDAFLQNEMGVDISQINNQLEEITNQMVNNDGINENK